MSISAIALNRSLETGHQTPKFNLESCSEEEADIECNTYMKIVVAQARL